VVQGLARKKGILKRKSFSTDYHIPALFKIGIISKDFKSEERMGILSRILE